MLKKPTEINILNEIPKKFVDLNVKNGEYINYSSKSYEILYKSIEKYCFIAPLSFNLTKIITFDKEFDFDIYLKQQRKVAYNFMRDTFPLQTLHACITIAIKKYGIDYWESIAGALDLANHIRFEPTEPKAINSFVEYVKKLCNYDALYYAYSWNVNRSRELEFPIKFLDLSVITKEEQISNNLEANGAILASWVNEGLLIDRDPVPPIYIVGIKMHDKLVHVSATTDLKQFFYDKILKDTDDKINAMMQENEYRFVILEICNGNEKWKTIEKRVKEYKGTEVD